MSAQPARSCDRPVCSGPATASLTYDYAGRCAWLDDLDDEYDPHAYDLCADHADRLTVPRGWVWTTAAPRCGRCSTCRWQARATVVAPTSRSDRTGSVPSIP